MSYYPSDLIKGWKKERAILQKKIAGFREGKISRSMTFAQVEATIMYYEEVANEYQELIEKFNCYEATPVLFERATPDEEIISQFRFKKPNVSADLSAGS